jgi:hypothetical protein
MMEIDLDNIKHPSKEALIRSCLAVGGSYNPEGAGLYLDGERVTTEEVLQRVHSPGLMLAYRGLFRAVCYREEK